MPLTGGGAVGHGTSSDRAGGASLRVAIVLGVGSDRRCQL